MNYHNKICGSLNVENQLSSKKWWQVCKFIYSGNSKQFTIPSIVDNGNIYSDTKDKAEVLNSFFSSVSQILDNPPPLPPLSENIPSSLNNIYITENDVIDILSQLKLSKASGPDGINHTILKQGRTCLAKPLSLLFNMSLQEKRYPCAWKKSNVIPLFKKSDSSNKENYRPISLLSCTSKVFERCIFKYLFNYLSDSDLLSKNQSGYSPGDSSVYQLVTMYHNICSSLDAGNDVQMIFLI